jgi:hypothetical protein
MAIPTENLAIRKCITTRAAYVVGFPFAPTFSTSIDPDQLLVTPNIGMIMCLPSTLTPSPRFTPCLVNNIIRKCHFTPPNKSKGNYSTYKEVVNALIKRGINAEYG